VQLLNAAHMHNVPGRKTDVTDAAWIARLVEHGLVRASFVPPRPIRRLRDLTRYRAALTAERTREKQRMEKLLEDAGIKLSVFVSDIFGTSGRAMLSALVDGERDPEVLAACARGRMRPKIPMLVQALTGSFEAHHAFLCRTMLSRIDGLDAAITAVTAQIETEIVPFQAIADRLDTIPGVNQRVAQVIIAEIGVDMTQFPTAAHLDPSRSVRRLVVLSQPVPRDGVAGSAVQVLDDGGMRSSRYSWGRSVLKKWTQFRVSISTWSRSRQGPWRRISSVLNEPTVVSARALTLL
jgi:transposase